MGHVMYIQVRAILHGRLWTHLPLPASKAIKHRGKPDVILVAFPYAGVIDFENSRSRSRPSLLHGRDGVMRFMILKALQEYFPVADGQ